MSVTRVHISFAVTFTHINQRHTTDFCTCTSSGDLLVELPLNVLEALTKHRQVLVCESSWKKSLKFLSHPRLMHGFHQQPRSKNPKKLSEISDHFHPYFLEDLAFLFVPANQKPMECHWPGRARRLRLAGLAAKQLNESFKQHLRPGKVT